MLDQRRQITRRKLDKKATYTAVEGNSPVQMKPESLVTAEVSGFHSKSGSKHNSSIKKSSTKKNLRVETEQLDIAKLRANALKMCG